MTDARNSGCSCMSYISPDVVEFGFSKTHGSRRNIFVCARRHLIFSSYLNAAAAADTQQSTETWINNGAQLYAGIRETRATYLVCSVGYYLELYIAWFYDRIYASDPRSDPPRTRAWNLRLRRPTPYPLGQQADDSSAGSAKLKFII